MIDRRGSGVRYESASRALQMDGRVAYFDSPGLGVRLPRKWRLAEFAMRESCDSDESEYRVDYMALYAVRPKRSDVCSGGAKFNNSRSESVR